MDESRRGQRYLLACASVEIHRVAEVRRQLQSLVVAPRRRIHFNSEPVARRRWLLERFDGFPVRVVVTETVIGHHQREYTARALLLTRLVEELQATGVTRLVIESRDAGDRDDRRVIDAVRRSEPALVYEHFLPGQEPLLWLADAYAWAVGAGRPWSDLVPNTLYRA